MQPVATVDEYISNFPRDIQEILNKIRETVNKAAPEASEKISYGMPTLHLNGNLIHFAAFKSHIGLYPTPSGITAFAVELSKYKGAKGSARFPLDKPIPYSLISKIVKYRVHENNVKAKTKNAK